MEKPVLPNDEKSRASKETGSSSKRTAAQQAPLLETLPRRSTLFFDMLRIMLILLGIVVAAGFVLILLPQATTDNFVEDLRSRSGASGREMIAFLYLGHEVQNGAFHIRGVVRNITTAPIEQLDAAIRLYSNNRELLETAVVRMNKETIDPDAIARFEMVYPDYQSEFSSYSVEFKLRRGAIVPYKDMRGLQQQSDPDPGGESE